MNATAGILVVDDESDIRELVALALSAAGYRILKARDGCEALAVLESERVDLIVADVAMPGMNGYQLYQRVAENPQWVTIPFLYLTGYSRDSAMRYGKELRAGDYLAKPFEIEDLLAAVNGRLQRSRQSSSESSRQSKSWPSKEANGNSHG